MYDGLRDIVHAMYELALATRKRFYLARCYHLTMTTYYMSLDFRSAVIYGQKALDAYEGSPSEAQAPWNIRGSINTRYFLSSCYLGLNDFESAWEVIAGINHAEPFGATSYARAMASWCRMAGEHAEAIRWNEHIIAESEKDGDDDEVCKRRAIACADAVRDFRFEEAALIENPDRLYCGFDAELSVGYYAALGTAYRLGGEGDASDRAFASARYHLEQARTDIERAQSTANLAWALLLAGERKEARETALAALAAANRCRHYAAAFSAELILAELAFQDSSREEFAFFLRDAAILAGAAIYRERAAMARFWFLAWLLVDSGDEDEGIGRVFKWEAADQYLAEARRLMQAELEALPDDRARERCLSLSVYGRILTA